MSALSPRIRVAVLRGGPPVGYDASLKSGAHILSLLRDMPDAYEPVDIFISKDREWHRGGVVDEPHRALKHIDVVWNALHGPYAEDEHVHKIFHSLRLPFTGSGALGSALSLDKEMAKKAYERYSLPTPRYAVVEEGFGHEELLHIFRNYMHPVIVKPAKSGASLGLRLARTFKELEEAVKSALVHSAKALVEEFIRGRHGTCGVIERAKGERLYTLMPVHLDERERAGQVSIEENRRIGDLAKLAHDALGLRHYSSSDFVITPKGGIYLIGTNAAPVLHEDSLMHRSLLSTGWRPHDFADHCVKLALNKV